MPISMGMGFALLSRQKPDTKVRRIDPRKVYRRVGTAWPSVVRHKEPVPKAGGCFNGVGVLEDASGFGPDVRSRLRQSTPKSSTAANGGIERHGKRVLRDEIGLLHVVERCV